MSSRLRDAFWRLRKYFGFLVLFLIGVLFFGGILFTIQDFTDYLPPVWFSRAATSSDAAAVLEVGNTAPTASGVVLNSGNAITLTANATTAVSVSVNITDNNGCADIQQGTTTVLVYRSGVTSSTCLTTQNNLNCYLATAFTASSTCSGAANSINATATVGIYYFAQPTDASNSAYSSQNWMATVVFKDPSNATGSADSSGVELNSLTAIDVGTSSIDYGTLNSSTTTGFTNQVEPILNAGNTSTTLKIHGTALVKGSDRIATSSQHYASSSFYFGGSEQQLQGTATTISGITLWPRVSLVNDLGSWTETTALPDSPLAAAHGNSNGYMYIFGGQDTSTVRYAQFNSNGTIGSWTNTTAMGSPRYAHGAVVYNGYAYVVGGEQLSPSSEYGAINSNGTITTWNIGDGPPTGGDISNFPLVAYNGYLYILGGLDGTSASANVYYSPIGSDRSPGTWVNTTNLPVGVRDPAGVAYGGYMYLIGGRATAGNTSTVRYAPINSSGTLGSWTNTTALPSAITAMGATVLNGYIYVVGGTTTTVLYAQIGSSGSIGTWATSTSLSYSVARNGLLKNNGFIYEIPNDSSTSTVLYASVNNGRNQEGTFWGLQLGYEPPGTYSGVTTFTAVYEP